MYVTPEQVSASGKAGVESLLGLANAQFAAYERLWALNLNITRTAFEDSVNYARAVMGAKDVQEVVNLSAAAAQPALEKALAYSRQVYEVSSQAQGEVTRVMEAQAAEVNRNMSSMLDKLAKNAPAGSDVAVAAVKSALAAANTAYDSFSKVAKQANEIAEANLAAAANAAKDNAKKKVA
jgi:phasin family protein